jgi:secreted trypsin-like serine protease
MTHIPRADGTFYNSACSAALISPTWIITAGHCFHDKNRVPVSGPVPYATTATLNNAAADQRARPSHWQDLLDLVSPTPGETTDVIDVQQSTTSDVALARLATPVADVSPLGLSDTGPAADAVLTIAGWGATTGFLPTPSTHLTIGQVKIQTLHPTTITVVGSYPAADTSACLYDSGAPYFTTPPGAPPQLVSTESTGPACPHASAETTARVDTLTTWIKSIVLDLP